MFDLVATTRSWQLKQGVKVTSVAIQWKRVFMPQEQHMTKDVLASNIGRPLELMLVQQPAKSQELFLITRELCTGTKPANNQQNPLD